MKCKTMKHGSIGLQCMMLAFVFAVCFTGCKDSKDETSAPYDPNQPVEVTDFTPKSGGGKKKMIIYGSNFGTDPSLVSVKVGGKEAIVISAKGTSIYCSTPESCFEGTIEVKVGEQTVMASEKYQYEPQMVVTDLCGDVDELGEGNIVETGPFDDCGKIDYPFWFSFDPQHSNILYLSQNNGLLRVLDLEQEMIYTKKLDNINRATTITWTNDGDMILAAPQNGGAKNRNNIILKRENSTDGQDFKGASWVALARGNACNGSMVLPQTGELYFNHRATGSVYRYNFEENGYNNNPEVPGGSGLNELLAFSVPNQTVDFSMVPHPTGKYVYIIMHESHYILRSNYDEETKKEWGYTEENGYPKNGYDALVFTNNNMEIDKFAPTESMYMGLHGWNGEHDGHNVGTKLVKIKIHHEATTKQVWKVDQKSYDEKVLVGYKCDCGSVKE